MKWAERLKVGMLFDDDLENLPNEPEPAFVKLVEILNQRLADANDQEWPLAAHEYVQVILAFADEHQITLPIDRTYPRNKHPFFDWFAEFKDAVTYAQNRFRFRNKSGVPVGVAAVPLNDKYRTEIHKLLGRIRKVVARLQISERKREAIYTKIGALAIEVDKDRTRLDALMDLVLEGTATLGEAAENLEPAVKLIEKLNGIFAKAKVESEPPALPSPDGEGVAKRITGPAVAESEPPPSGDLDDEIPF